MEVQTNKLVISTGCLDSNHERDGDIGVREKPSALCPETSSRNYMNPPGREQLVTQSSLINGRELPITPVRASLEATSTEVQEGRARIGTPQATNSQELCLEDVVALRRQRLDLEHERGTFLSKLGKKAGFRFGTLNIKGKKLPNGRSKYKDLSSIMRNNKLAIMAITETKLKEGDEDTLEKENPLLHFENNPSEDNDGTKGIAMVLNKDQISNKKWTHNILIPGRASELLFEWNDENELCFLAIYAPNDAKEKIEFFLKIKNLIYERKNKNLILLGDFNIVEDAVDRTPMIYRDKDSVKTLINVCSKANLIDGWRNTNSNELDYTYFHTNGSSASRIDRIYVKEELFKFSMNWKIDHRFKLSDHDIVWTELLKKNLPYIGQGRWRLANDMIDYLPFMKDAKKALKATEKEMLQMKEGQQQSLLKVKEKIKELAQTHQKKRNEKLKKQETKLTNKLQRRLQKLNEECIHQTKTQQAVHNKRAMLQELKGIHLKKAQDTAKARHKLMGERNTKYWFALNKKRLGDDPIIALEDKNGNLIRDTNQMAKRAAQYHAELQATQKMTYERKEAIEKIENLDMPKFTEEDKEILEIEISEEEIADALKAVDNGKAPGLDGLPYEFWKAFPSPKSEEAEKTEPNIPLILKMAFNDIERSGIADGCFIKGVMFLLYKKKEKTKVENYRPLTLLNTDYKTMTKVIATRLGLTAATVIHPAQAGFVPGRSLFDHVKLSQTMIDYCEAIEKNGCIMALDQEKAYDKIAHDYLWTMLKKYEMPTSLINTIKALYKGAKTSVMVNNVSTFPIDIKRGVRQGDPMSCLLYNMAIEPLAFMLRKSNLKGMKIPGEPEKLVATLFADDTLVYLDENDDVEKLYKILNIFCTASTAKFNLEKTEVLPMGKKDYREKVTTQRKLNDNQKDAFEPNVRVVKDGESMRTLGAWVGNNANANPKWNEIIKRQKKILETWKQSHLSYRGKELVLKALVLSTATFLATVNGMPDDIKKQTQKITKDFVWDDKKRGLLPWKTIINPRKDGGLNMPDLQSRLEAIELMWLKRYLSPNNTRPLWAKATDALIATSITRKPIIDDNAKLGWILQSWHESEAKDTKIPIYIKRMLNTARKYNIGLDGMKLDHETKTGLPIWHHLGVTTQYLWNKKAARCLRNNHKIKTVGDLITPINNAECENTLRCEAIASQIINTIPPKFNPIYITPYKDNLEHTPETIKRYAAMSIEDAYITFDPNVKEKGDPLNAVRIFQKHKTYKIRRHKDEWVNRLPAERIKPKKINSTIDLTLATARKQPKSGKGKAAFGAWCEEDNTLNMMARVKNNSLHPEKVELLAINEILEKYKNNHIRIRSKNKFIMEGLVKKLKQWEDTNFQGVSNEQEWKLVAYKLRVRRAKTSFQWIKEKNDKIYEKAKTIAKKGLELTNKEKISYQIDDKFKIEGMRLSKITQKIAYEEIRTKYNCTPMTKGNAIDRKITAAQKEIKKLTKNEPTRKAIWNSLHKQIDMKVGDFIWKYTHNRIKCGKFFKHIPNWEDKQYCICGNIESPDHILFECKKNGQHEIWKQAKKTWKKLCPEHKWIKPTSKILPAIPAIKFPAAEDSIAHSYEAKRYKNFVSAAIWTIWTARNSRIFNNETINGETLCKQWIIKIKQEALIDLAMVKLYPFKKREVQYNGVVMVWGHNGTLLELPEENPYSQKNNDS